MFKLQPDPTFVANVRLRQPGGVVRTLRVTFRYLDQDAYTAAFEATRDKMAEEFVARLVANWDTADGPNGEWEGIELPYSPAALTELRRAQPAAMRAFIDTYHHEVLGLPLKN